jgi:hypothetical protein
MLPTASPRPPRRRRVRTFRPRAGAAALLAAPLAAAPLAAAPLAAQTYDGDRLSVHGSLNAGYGRSSRLPVLGIPTSGTADYRIATLQVRYAFAEKDQFVVQVLNRRVGASPLRTAVDDVSAQWAFWQHRAGALSLKVGRNPFPRGLLNEARYIGTLFPFFRVSAEFTGDAFDAVDGVVASYRRPLAGDWAVEGHAMGGGTENRSVRATADALTARNSRANNLVGGQLYVDAPFGVRLGVHGTRYERVDQASEQRGYRAFYAYSAQLDRPRYLVRSEYVRETGHGPASDIGTAYAQGVARASGRVHLAAEHTYQRQRVFPAGAPSADVESVRSTGAAVNLIVGPAAVLKLEHHWRRGYTFDAYTPPTRPLDGATAVNPQSRTTYWIASAAVSF